MNTTFKCSICGKDFTDIDNYVKHVSKCAEEHKKKETENLQKLNDDLNRVKAAKTYYEEQLAKFKEEHPEAYELNFGSKDEVNTFADKSDRVEESLEEVPEDLKTDPFVHHVLNILNLLD